MFALLRTSSGDSLRPRRPSLTSLISPSPSPSSARPFPPVPTDDALATTSSSSTRSAPGSPRTTHAPLFTPDSPHRPTSWARTDPFYAPPHSPAAEQPSPRSSSTSSVVPAPALLFPDPARPRVSPANAPKPRVWTNEAHPAAVVKLYTEKALPPPPGEHVKHGTFLPGSPASPPLTSPSPNPPTPAPVGTVPLVADRAPADAAKRGADTTAPAMPTEPLSISKKITAQPARRARTAHRPAVQDITEELGEYGDAEPPSPAMGATHDGPTGAGVLGAFDRKIDRSVLSFGAKQKAEKVLGMGPHPMLASLYLVSGLAKACAADDSDPEQWTLADAETTRGIQMAEDSLGLFWRPDMLGNTFSGEKSEDWSRERRAQRGTSISIASVLSKDVASRALPDAGPDGASKLVARTLKYAHPRDIEVVNSTLAPPTTCHTFQFTIPRRSTLKAIARAEATLRAANSRAAESGSQIDTFTSINSFGETTTIRAAALAGGTSKEDLRALATGGDLTFYGCTLTVWSHADRDRAAKLREVRRAAALQNIAARPRTRHWPTGTSGLDLSESGVESEGEAIGMASALRRTQKSNASSTNLPAGYGSENSDVFWMPYAITLVSQHPVYDVMQDYLRLSWARYSKDAKNHMKQICRLLNHEAPRPGEVYRLPIGSTIEDEVTIEGVMPGELDFDRGITKVDYQMWPLFQALDIDHIVTCVEIALSHSGRVAFYSRHPAMLGVAINTLKHLVELRGWQGIALPMLHARDCTFMIEDPGPYIVGVPTECRYLVRPPAEVAIVDIDMNTLALKSPPPNVLTPRSKREKAKHKILAALGPSYPIDKVVPMEYKVSYPRGSFRNINRVVHAGTRPGYLAERLKPPDWWRQTDVMAIFDKIMTDKHKKPTLLQRLTGASTAKTEARLTMNEQLAKEMMRKRALHYVETRDDFDLKVARINRRLQKLVEEGDHWKKQFEVFERYAERLTQESSDLRNKIEREKREARRLSAVAHEQDKMNNELQDRLSKTETARAEAMRQLSDMNQSIQDLERERDDIMNVIELQITTALASMPLDDESEASYARPPTPTESIGTTNTLPQNAVQPARQRRTARPATRDSARTAMSRFTVESQPISVLAAARGSVRKVAARPGTAGSDTTGAPSTVPSGAKSGGGTGSSGARGPDDALRVVDRLLADKTDSIAERVALIQAKLELALSATRMESSSIADTDEDVETLDESGTAPSPEQVATDTTVTPENIGSKALLVDAAASDVSSPASQLLLTPVATETANDVIKPAAAAATATAVPGSPEGPDSSSQPSLIRPTGRFKAGRGTSSDTITTTSVRPTSRSDRGFSKLFARVAAENATFDRPADDDGSGARSSFDGRSSSSSLYDDDLADVEDASLHGDGGQYVVKTTRRMSVSTDKASLLSADKVSVISHDKASVVSQDKGRAGRAGGAAAGSAGSAGSSAEGGAPASPPRRGHRQSGELRKSGTSVMTVTFGEGGERAKP